MKDLRSVTCFFLLIFCGFQLFAQHKKIIPSIFIKDSRSTSNSLSDKYQNYMLQLRPGIKNRDLLNNSLRVVRILDNGVAIVWANQRQINDNIVLFHESYPVNDLWKLEDDVRSRKTSEFYYFTVKANSPETIKKTLSVISDIKVTWLTDNTLTLYATLDSVLKHVIVLEDVSYVGIESAEPKEESRVLDMNLNPNTVNRIQHTFPGLTGDGVTISFKELHYNTEDIDLDGRHVPSSLGADEESNHATDMATIAAGAGNSFVTGRGVAGAANITSSDFANLLPDPDEYFASLDTWIQNHSYGTVIENFYGVLAEAYDKSANRNPQLLHIFSTGNEGAATSTSGAYQGISGFANLTGNFKMSKNSIIVGSVDTVGRAVSFSSRGPAYDGRIKPELVAYSVAGSSNSTALVSGVVVLLQQAYKEANSSLPPAALLKSLLINSAVDAGSPGIDYITGFGNVDAYRTLINLRDGNYFSGNVQHGETKTFSLQIPSSVKNLKITLVWNDPAALANASIALVNDLDMKLETGGDTWLPWTLNSSADINQLVQPAIRSKDHLNTIEQITLTDPSPGTYTVSIEGFDVMNSPQQFYIAYQWDTLNVFEWKFPTGSDNIPYNGETATYFYWNTTLTDNSGKLEYTIDDGITWNVIKENIDLRKGYYRWSEPPAITAVAKARMAVASAFYETEQFTISQPLDVSIGFNCIDSVMIQWPSLDGVDQYEVFTFNNTFIEPLTITSDTAIILNKNQFTSRLYSIQPLLKDGLRAIRSPTFDYSTLGTGCFLFSFFDEVVPEEGIYLNVQLGTTYGVDKVLVEHEKNGIFVVVANVQVVGNSNIRILHEVPHQGLNRYRARIQLLNGEEVLSEVVENYFLTKIPFIVFPNPVSASGELRIFSKEFKVHDVTFRLFRTDGTLVGATELISDREFVPLGDLAPGLYIYSISSEEGYFNGRIVVK